MNHHDMTNIGIARASNNALKDEVAGLNQYRKALEAKHAALVEAVENHCADLLYWANLNIYSVELRDEINRMVDKIKAAAQENNND